MPTQQTSALRMFCLCGQKMRVTETMYGRRARCVACQLKIRIPRFEEVPHGSTELHLHDHPEFIRAEKAPSTDAAPSSARSSRRGKRSITVPIDPSEPLQQLCSIDKKLKRELAQAEGAAKSDLEAYTARLDEIHAAFDDEMHQRLMETSIELTAAREKLAELTLAARVGELDYRAYCEQANRVRWRRECLERRQINLRAWLAVRDADLAGGYVDMPLSRMEEIEIGMPLLEDHSEPEVLLQWMVEQLRAAYAARTKAETQLEAVREMCTQHEFPEQQLKRSAKEQKATRARATACVRFWQGRIEHFKKDILHDQRVIEAQLELARGRRQLGELSREQSDAAERALRQAKADLEKAQHTIERTLSARSERDVPALRGTFVARLGAPAAVNPRDRKSAVFAILGLLFMAALAAGVVAGVFYGVIPWPRLTGRGSHVAPRAEFLAPPSASPGEGISTLPDSEPPFSPGTQEEIPSEPDAATSEPEQDEVDSRLPEDVEAVDAEETETGILPEDAMADSGTTPADTVAEETDSIEVELRGVVTTTNRAPRFSLRIHAPGGASYDRVRELGGSVAEGWIIRDYNPEHQSITLFDGDNILVLRRGEREPLPPSATPEH